MNIFRSTSFDFVNYCCIKTNSHCFLLTAFQNTKSLSALGNQCLLLTQMGFSEKRAGTGQTL